jgi:NADPH:quinone reductase-like Zn-dependent oxidoreductase
VRCRFQSPVQVLVRVHAVALNNVDPQMLAQAYDVSTGTGTEYLAGYEFAGDVVSVGSDVRGVEVGWRVMGTTPRSFAQYVACDHRHLIRPIRPRGRTGLRPPD